MKDKLYGVAVCFSGGTKEYVYLYDPTVKKIPLGGTIVVPAGHSKKLNTVKVVKVKIPRSKLDSSIKYTELTNDHILVIDKSPPSSKEVMPTTQWTEFSNTVKFIVNTAIVANSNIAAHDKTYLINIKRYLTCTSLRNAELAAKSIREKIKTTRKGTDFYRALLELRTLCNIVKL